MEKLAAELEELQQTLAQPETVADSARFRELSIRYSALEPTVSLYRQYQRVQEEIAEVQALLEESSEAEMRQFLSQEREQAEQRLAELEDKIMRALVPKDPMDEKKALIEVRAGTGGDEAALFARDLFEMYTRFAERKGWDVEVLQESEAEMGGFREVVFQVNGKGAYGILRSESGVHRVQRVPETESQGRIHTSAATVAVLPEVKEVDVELAPTDLKVETFRAGGPGGQHMQKNDTAVRITHVPTGLAVVCSNQRSQLQNRERALSLLRARLYEIQRQKQEQARVAQRREQIKSGDRSEKIRTYNFPQDRLTDHRLGLTLHNLPALMVGEIDELIAALQDYREKQHLEQIVKESE